MIKGQIIALAAMAAGAAYSAMTYFVDSMTFDRDPKMKLPGSGSGTAKLTGIAKEGQEWLHEHDTDVRYMVNSEGLKLKAHYFPAANAERTVIEFHGWHSAWDIDFSASAPYMHERGCNLLLVEERGQGGSEGKEMTFGVKESKDVMEWIDWYQKEIDDRIPVYLAGVSMGASAVLLTAANEFPPQVKGILADCGFSSAYQIMRIVGHKSFHTPEHPFMDTFSMFCKLRHGFDLRDGDVTYAMEHAKLPILFIHGKSDHFVPCWMTAESYEKCNGEKDILLVEGAGHGKSFLVDTKAYLDKVDHFFARYDER